MNIIIWEEKSSCIFAIFTHPQSMLLIKVGHRHHSSEERNSEEDGHPHLQEEIGNILLNVLN